MTQLSVRDPLELEECPICGHPATLRAWTQTHPECRNAVIDCLICGDACGEVSENLTIRQAKVGKTT